MFVGENDLVFAKVKPNAIIPSKTEENAGYDIYACFDKDYWLLKPHTTELIPTGIASALHKSKYIQLEERGSTGSKGIKRSAGVIDSGYHGEWFVAITNTNDFDLVIAKEPLYSNKNELLRKFGNMVIVYPYSKAIAQAIVHEVPRMNVSEVTYQDLLTITSERGTGSLGSSNK